ncbi:gamma-glutamyltransferase family protein [Paracoccus ravus]|uniref:gamma-glutamyltransferase family protein n=1 Tax=Paracoccus ravus TaxID=2447760 RepID=UPI001FD68CF8|nr:gamma-glutamyltransferase [Paracoccus ravus]
MKRPVCEPMVASPHPLATMAGCEVLRRGGNAAEAALAVGAALAVVMPHFCGLGGDGVFLLSDRSGLHRAMLAIGQAPQVLPELPDELPLRGPGSMLTTACVVDGWDRLLAHGRSHWEGRATFDQLVAPALALAQDGFTPSASQRFWLDYRALESAAWPGFGTAFGDATGHFRQPGLAGLLRLMAADGPRSFYDGEAARLIAEGLSDVGSCLTAQDLAATRTREVEPLALDYRGLTLLAPPPPTQGLTTLQIMGILGQFDLSGDEAARMHLLVEAVKQAFLDRAEIAEGMAEGDIARLLSSDHLALRAAKIDAERAMPWPRPCQHGDTVFFAVTDGSGNAVSALQSTYFDWGSGVVLGDTGVLWQNRGSAFATAAGHPNRIEPGKRPFYTLNPGIALRDGMPHLLYGTQGADGQPQTLAVLLSALIDAGLPPDEALAMPRFLLGRSFSDSRDSLKLEASLSAQTFSTLSALGHETTTLPALSPIFGCAGAIQIMPEGRTLGAHDPRGQGNACAVT